MVEIVLSLVIIGLVIGCMNMLDRLEKAEAFIEHECWKQRMRRAGKF